MPSANFLFIGMNTANDPADLDPAKGECADILNMDPDNDGSVSTRDGAVPVITGAAYHSGWSPDGKVAYLVRRDGWLCSFDGTTVTTLYAVDPNLPMAFAPVNDLVVASNGRQYLIIEPSGVSPAKPSLDPFKVAPPAGQCLAYYNGRLYIASGNVLVCTDPFTVDQCDERQMRLPITQDRITGLAALEGGGLIIGTTREVFALLGGDPFSGEGMALRKLADYGMIPGTALVTAAEKVPRTQFQGMVALWASPRGFCAASNTGAFVNFSERSVAFPQATSGAAMLREEDGIIHYVAALGSGDSFNIYDDLPVLDMDSATLG